MSSQEMDALIVRHLQDIENASRRINDEIQKNVGDAIDAIVEKWSREKDWCSLNLFNDVDCFLRLAPKKWRLPVSDEKVTSFLARSGSMRSTMPRTRQDGTMSSG